MSKKICPMKFTVKVIPVIQESAWNCSRDKCAWFVNDECAMAVIASRKVIELVDKSEQKQEATP